MSARIFRLCSSLFCIPHYAWCDLFQLHIFCCKANHTTDITLHRL